MIMEKEERLFMYKWLSNMLGHELSASQLNQYQQGLFNQFFDYLNQHNWQQWVDDIKQTFKFLAQDKMAHLELAADYAQLFLLDGKHSALPYASVYLPLNQQEQHFAFLEQLLNRYQLQLNQDKHEASDHLCVYLALLHKLVEQDDLTTYRILIKDYLLTWLPEFWQKVQKIKVTTPFYTAIVGLLVSFLQTEINSKQPQ